MARTKKTATKNATPVIVRSLDMPSLEKRVYDMDGAKIRNYDLFSLEKRIYNLEMNGGGGGGEATQYFTREHTDPVTGNATILKTGKFILWTDLSSQHLNTYGFTLNEENANTLISAGLKSTQEPTGQGFGYAYYEFELTAGDIFAWSCAYNNRCFVMFSE